MIIGGTLGGSQHIIASRKNGTLGHLSALGQRQHPHLCQCGGAFYQSGHCSGTGSTGKWGAPASWYCPPCNTNPPTRETVDFFLDIAKSTDLPIMVYNNPVDYKVEVTLDMFEALLKKDNIQAVKESTRDVSNVTRIINRFGSGPLKNPMWRGHFGNGRIGHGRTWLGRRIGGCFSEGNGCHLPFGQGWSYCGGTKNLSLVFAHPRTLTSALSWYKTSNSPK